MKATQTLPLKNYRWKGINSNGKKRFRPDARHLRNRGAR